MRNFFILLSLLALVSCGGRNREPEPTRYSTASFQGITYPVFGDFKPYDWEGITPRRYPIHGIDVAKYQGEIDWQTARRSGVSFAFIKATEGGDHLDENFAQNWNAAARSGLPRGAYHFYYFCRTAREQARWYMKNVPNDPGALPPVLDIEWNHQSRTCPYKPDSSTVRREIETFIAEITRNYQKRPIIYTTPDFYKENNLGRISSADFWLRSVAGHPSKVYPGQRWLFWQYTGTGKVPGITGKVDINAFTGSSEAWQGWLTRVTQ